MVPVTSWVEALVAPVSALAGVGLTLLFTGRREARARSWEQRRAAYLTFLRELHDYYRHVEAAGQSGGGGIGDPEPEGPMRALLSEVELFGTRRAHLAASVACDALYAWAYLGRPRRMSTVDGFVAQARRDLRVPGAGGEWWLFRWVSRLRRRLSRD